MDADAEKAKAKLAAVAEELGHEIRVFTNPASAQTSNEAPVSANEEPDSFYDFTAEDYYRMVSDKLGAQTQVLKTRKIREAEAAARRAKISKALIRVCFPDNYILEAKFQPSENIQSLFDLVQKVVARPDLPFYLYTTPPKERIKDMSKDLYSAGFAPGAIVYFSYDRTKGSEVDSTNTGPCLREDILSLNGLDYERVDPVCSKPEPVVTETLPSASESRPIEKKPPKSIPSWLRTRR
ncbi:plant UBX domain-containing protein 1 isoform X1 [Iris pallida]|uniref:Plant UBX domain-containing protein 1 isoform X1 n=1 Tax=Iris pallida TaxID=29817 RepID=A0AAX6G9A7_IRIPA|nr:plant UBX domain-containing protein 1 isoform X1 [Iris pallida]KAJ6843751.1 plant UBX domain-containing protein 1 isoform X1 [Iris pallida]